MPQMLYVNIGTICFQAIGKTSARATLKLPRKYDSRHCQLGMATLGVPTKAETQTTGGEGAP